MKCDEQLPVCQNCINSKRKCYRGIRLNFTQYTFYDPDEATSAIRLPAAPKLFRLLDQSIAILSQYRNGRRSYRNYSHLHTQQDLEEAEHLFDLEVTSNKQPVPESLESQALHHVDSLPYNSRLEYGMDSAPMMATDPEPWEFVGGPPDQMMYNFSEDTILENFDIKNVLMNPHMQMPEINPGEKEPDSAMSTTFTPMVEFPSQERLSGAIQRPRVGLSPFGEVGLMLTPIDSHAFVKLIQNERYYWLLDLFNDLHVWKTMVPNYCVRIVQAVEADEKLRGRRNPTFLLDCLMDCKEFTSMDRILHNAKEQQIQWQEFEHKDVTVLTFRAFEQILLSIVLILLGMLLQASKPAFVITDTFNMVLANQGRMFRKVVTRFQRIPAAMLKSVSTTLFMSVSFQAIVIIRFFLKMQLKKIDVDYDSNYTAAPYVEADALDAAIAYDLSTSHNVGEFFTLTPFEEEHLATQFQDMELGEFEMARASDAGKLRQYFWTLVLLDNYGVQPNAAYSEPEESLHLGGKVQALRSNEQCIALNLLAAYAQKIRGGGGVDADTVNNTKLHEIFHEISMSSMGQDIKSKWTSHFQWTTEV